MSAPITTMLIWNGIKIMVTHTPNYCKVDIDHIELHVENHERIPVTETGYRSHFCHGSLIEPYGSVLAFVQAWLDHEALSPKWQTYAATSKQLSLF